MIQATVTWNDARLNAAVLRGYRESMLVTAAQADAAGGAHAGAVLRGNSLSPTGLGAVFERGGEPHTEGSAGEVMYLAGLDIFVRGPVSHPGTKPRPYLGPAAAAWTRLAPAIMRAALAGAGFR